MPSSVLVTGGAGFIGSHVADALLAAGHRVTVLDDLSSGRRENVPTAARFVHGDIRDEPLLERLFAQDPPEFVCHQAAQTSVAVSTREPLRDASVNVLGTLALLRCAARQEVARFVFASTGGAIYGEVPAGLARVGDHERPASPYACSKLAAESYVRWAGLELGVPSTILRYANVYGPRQDPHGEAGVVAIFSERILRGEPLRVNARTHEGDPGCVRDYVHVDDVVHANLEAIAGRLREPVVHVATGVATCTADLADALQAAAGRQVPRTSGPRRAGDLERSVLAPSPELPPPRSLEEGLRSTMDWFRGRTRPA